jgi:cardiolipin synthase A/B
VSVGSALGAALTNRRALDPAESNLLMNVSIVTIVFAIVAAIWPQVIAWPLGIIGAWVGIAWVIKAVMVRQQRARAREATVAMPTAVEPEQRDGKGA